MSIRRLILGLLGLIPALVAATGVARAAAPVAADAPSTRPAGGPGSPAVIISLSGEIDDYTRDALFRKFDKARALGAKTVVLEIETYGGLVTAGTEIARFLRRQDDLRTVAFVKDRAISAGAMIAVACDEIVMSPASVIGDCAPIVVNRQRGTLEALPTAERAKLESPVVADFLASATRNGYDPLLLTSMVSVGTVVHYVESDAGERRFVDEATYKQLTEKGQWRAVPGLPNPVDPAERLLTVDADTAGKLGISKGQAASAAALAAERGYAVLADLTPSAGERAVDVLGKPFVRGILIAVFLLSLWVALHTPGTGVPEAVALVSLGVLVGVPLLTGHAAWWEIAIIFVGLALIAFELFVFPGHFVSIILGTVLLLGGLLMTFVGDLFSVPGSWRLPSVRAQLEAGLFAILGSLVATMILGTWLRRFLPRLPYFSRLILTQTAGASPAAEHDAATEVTFRHPSGAVEHDHWPFVGTVGVAMTDLRPGGAAEFPYGGTIRQADVTSEAGYVERGAKVVVREIHGSSIVVRPVPPAVG